jgi:hypothetical protein
LVPAGLFVWALSRGLFLKALGSAHPKMVRATAHIKTHAAIAYKNPNPI